MAHSWLMGCIRSCIRSSREAVVRSAAIESRARVRLLLRRATYDHRMEEEAAFEFLESVILRDTQTEVGYLCPSSRGDLRRASALLAGATCVSLKSEPGPDGGKRSLAVAVLAGTVLSRPDGAVWCSLDW